MPHVLIIDHDPQVRDLLRIHLRSRGFFVRVAEDAAEGIRAILASAPDVVVAEVALPYMNGLELLEAIRGDEISARLPVIFLTTRSDDDTWMAAMRRGVSEYLTKPARIEDLVRSIQVCVRDGERAFPVTYRPYLGAVTATS